MISVILPNTDEPTVVQLTYENLSRELQSVIGSEIVVADSWAAGVAQCHGDYICLVEPDCLVSAGYFSSNLGLYRKHAHYRKLAMMASCFGVDSWKNRIFHYRLGQIIAGNEQLSTTYWTLMPQRKKYANTIYPVQVGFVPGAIFRRTALLGIMGRIDFGNPDLIDLSTKVSFHFWNTNRRIAINPNTTYVSTDRRLENPGVFDPKVPRKVGNIFEHEEIP
jgi:hypothetical protein